MEIMIAFIIVAVAAIVVLVVAKRRGGETVVANTSPENGGAEQQDGNDPEKKARKKLDRKIEKTFRSDRNADQFFDSIGIFVAHSDHKEYPRVVETKSMKDALRVGVILPDEVTPDEFANHVRRGRKQLKKDGVNAEAGVTMTGDVFIDVFPAE